MAARHDARAKASGRPNPWPDAWLTPDWPAPANVMALCSTRPGGMSAGPWAGLNLAAHVGDDPSAVTGNRARLRAHLPAEPLWLTQVHGVNVVDPAGYDPAVGPQADAARTRAIDTPCAVLTADCLPILLCDRGTGRSSGPSAARQADTSHPVGLGIGGGHAASAQGLATEVAAIHAGWRGLADGVLEATAAAMRTRPQDWLAWIGPGIGRDAFECGEEVLEAFCNRHPEARQAFRKAPGAPGRWLGDLPAIARQRLVALGMPAGAIYGGTLCTVSDPERFYSFRRDGVTGRMASLIWLSK